MTSNEDPTGEKKAYDQILFCTIFNSALPCAMAYTGILHPYFLMPYAATQIPAFQAVFNFKKNKGDKKAAKQLKRASYPPFMVLLVGFVATTAYNKFN